MRAIPAPRIGDSHGLMRALDARGRLRMDEFATEFAVEELYPPGLQDARRRTRQFMAYARAAGLVRDDRGILELSDAGRGYVRGGNGERPYDVAPGQADWLRRLLREQHTADTIYRGLAAALGLVTVHADALALGRALSRLDGAGWDDDRTQGERHLTLLRDMELIGEDGALTAAGERARAELGR